MPFRGRHFLLLAITLTALAGCGSEATPEGGALGNLPPIISGTPATTIVEGSSYAFTPAAADPEGDSLTFSVTNKPSWAQFNPVTGALNGTPAAGDVGMTGMISIEVSDGKSIAELPAFRIQVASNATVPPPANSAPTISGTPATTATVMQVYTFTPVGGDADNDTLTYEVENLPTWATFSAATGQLRGTPISTNVGTTSNIIIRVSDGQATAQLPAFNLTVSATAPTNRAPTITGTPATTVTAGSAYSFRPVASDPDGNTLAYSIQGQPSWAAFSATTGRLSGTPTSANVGTSARITITVTDGTLSASLASFTIQVTAAANRAPTISGTPGVSVMTGAAYSFQPSVTDADGDALSFTITGKPSWATFSTSLGRLSGTPAAGDVGSYSNIVISVTDGKAIVSLPAFSISVVAVASGAATVNWTIPTTNTDGSTLADLAGYRVVYGTSSNQLDQSVAISNASLTTYTVANLTSGQWYFAVFAVTSSGQESDISNIATKTLP
jgi:hypothetical protein